jgi:hypothetical protein
LNRDPSEILSLLLVETIQGSVNFNGLGGGWTLVDGFTTTNYVYLNAGTLSTNNQPVSAVSFESSS